MMRQMVHATQVLQMTKEMPKDDCLQGDQMLVKWARSAMTIGVSD
jgi:hypothetical protein